MKIFIYILLTISLVLTVFAALVASLGIMAVMGGWDTTSPGPGLVFLVVTLLLYFFWFRKKIKNKKTPTAIIGSAILILWLIGVLVFLSSGHQGRSALNARISTDLRQMRNFHAFYSEQVAYENFNCELRDVKIVCDDIEEIAGAKPTIHATKNDYCAYVKLPKKKVSVAPTQWGCVDFRRSIHTYVDPGGPGYCSGETFRCPEIEGTPPATAKRFIDDIWIIGGGIALMVVAIGSLLKKKSASKG